MAVEAQRAELCRSMLEKAKRTDNSHEAESWLLTAKSLMPLSFSVQMTTYDIQCKKQNAAAAAETLTQMYLNFKDESKFWVEINRLVKSLQEKNGDRDFLSITNIISEIFESLLPALQLQLLLNLAEKEKEAQSQVDLLLLLLHRFPDHVDTFGLQLIEVLTQLIDVKAGDKLLNWPNVADMNTRILVCDVLPVLLRNQELPLTETHSLQLFDRALRFYLAHLSLSRPYETSSATSSSTEFYLPDPLKSLVDLFQSLTERLHWTTGNRLRSYDIATVYTVTKSLGRLPPTNLETVYTAFMSLVLLSFQYSKLMNRHSKLNRENVRLLVVLPSQRSTTTNQLRKIANCVGVPQSVTGSRKVSDLSPPITKRVRKNSFVGIGISTALDSSVNFTIESTLMQLSNYFKAGEPCCRLLKSDLDVWETEQPFNTTATNSFMRKFFELLKDPTNEIMDVSWLRVFLVDKLIYDGKYQLVIQKTQLEGECSVAAYIERAVAFYALANFSKACEQVRLAAPLAAPSCLAPSFGNEIFLESSSSCHKLGLINGTNEVISFIVSVIISCLCDAKLLKNPTDRIIGVIFVLSQMEWPLYRSLLTEMVCAIQMAKGLLWPGLIDYICLMDHLEQLSSLNHNHDDLALQIVKNSKNSSLAREPRCDLDVRLALEERVAKISSSTVDKVVQKFLEDYGETIEDCLRDV